MAFLGDLLSHDHAKHLSRPVHKQSKKTLSKMLITVRWE